jgi:uncharacterized protein
MMTFILAFGLLVLVALGMAVGVIFRGKPIKGSCGGMAALNMDTVCDICGGNPQKCDEEQSRKASLAYDAADIKKD